MKAIIKIAARVNQLFEKVATHLQSSLLLAVRLYWGWQFFQTGLGKLTGIDKVVEFFTSLGIPLPIFNAYLVGSLECVGGILLFLGLGSRIIALPLTLNMLVAYITADREALFSVFSAPGRFYGADPYTFFFASLLILIFGPGEFSLDWAIAYLRNKKLTGVDEAHERTPVSAT
jgi:putative oxidoreductase